MAENHRNTASADTGRQIVVQRQNTNEHPTVSAPTILTAVNVVDLLWEIHSSTFYTPKRVVWIHVPLTLIMGIAVAGCLTGASPVLLQHDNNCNLGFFCPNNTAQNPPEYCPPTTECLITRLQTLRNTCTEPQGVYEPVVCGPGYYCPPGGQQQRICPKDHYCPLGSFEPIPCDLLSSCPEGSARQYRLSGLAALIIVDLVLLITAFWPFLLRYWCLGRKSKWFSPEKDPDLNREVSLEDGGAVTTEESFAPVGQNILNLQHFVKSITRCIDSDNIGLEIGFDHLSFHLQKDKKIILYEVSGTVEKGSLLAVMGASGAGKSTFVRVLMGKLKHTSGSILINGIPRGMSHFKKIIGYVPQDDVVLPELTVRENLLHAARVRLPVTWTEAEIREHVDILISCLQLTQIQHSPVGDVINPTISGGQRKRVSIGIELAAAPMALVLDEPTSGLDATSALSIIELLKALCRQGVTVICIMHQPRLEIFQSLDRLLLLAEGRMVYLGEAANAVEYFKSVGFDIPPQSNPADVIMDIISGQSQRYSVEPLDDSVNTVSRLISCWKACEIHPVKEAPNCVILAQRIKDLDGMLRSAETRGAPWHRQVYLCFLRSLKQQSRQVPSFFLEIAVGAIAGLLIGLSVYKLGGLLFQGVFLSPFELLSSAVNYTLVPELGLLCSLAIALAAAAPGVKTFGEEKTIYWREASSGHSRSAYFVGKVLSTLFRLTLSALHFTVFYAVLATPAISLGTLYAANFLYFYCIYGLASCMSMITRREDGPLLAMIVSLIIGVFGGYGPPLSTIKSWHLEWAWRMCPGTWFSEIYFHTHTASLDYLYDIDAAAAWTGYSINNLGLRQGMLVIIGTFYRGLAFAGLVAIDRDKQI